MEFLREIADLRPLYQVHLVPVFRIRHRHCKGIGGNFSTYRGFFISILR